MAVTLSPIWPYHYLVAVLAGITISLLVLGLIFPRSRNALGRHSLTRLFVLTFTFLAALSLTAAAYNPQTIRDPIIPHVHLVVVLDVSDSVRRDEAGWEAARGEVANLLDTAVRNMPTEMTERAMGSLLTFGGRVNTVGGEMALVDLPAVFRRLDRADFAIGDATNIQAALLQAGQNIRRAGQRGAILLISDGNQTDGNAWEAAQGLARQGIPIYVYPLESRSPSLAIVSAYLPPQVDGRATANLRAVFQNYSEQEIPAQLGIYQNPGLENPTTRFGLSLAVETLVPMSGNGWASLRPPVPLQFSGVGLQYVDLVFAPQEGQGEQRRRLYTHVTRPIHVLAVGGDTSWLAALSPENSIVRAITAADLSPDQDFQDVDALVISGVPADEFRPGVLAAIAQEVEDNGLGLFVLNGDHPGGDEKTPTVLMSYENTPLEPLLPVTTDPRVIYEEPPTRHVVILIDASGSMGEGRLDKAKEIAIYIVRDLLRPTDFLDVVVFTTTVVHLVDDRLMDTFGKEYAISQINSIRVGGGTDPTEALRLVAGRQMTHCGLIFISDGELDPRTLSARPECRATVFLVGYSQVPPNAPMRQLADPIPAPSDFNPVGIQIPYFEPEPRDKFFEPGEYAPLTTDFFSAQIDRLPVPDLPLEGTAVTALKNEEGVVLTAVRPRFTDPVLAYKANGAGYVGAFTTGIPANWLDSEDGRQAIEAWIKRTVPYAARDRYHFRLIDRGRDMALQVTIIPSEDDDLEITDLAISLHIEGEAEIPIVMRLVDGTPGLFEGEIRLSRQETAQLATLIIKESGPHAISRPQQIPMLVAPGAVLDRVAAAEAYSYGLNEALLRAIADVGGGEYEPPVSTPFFRSLPVETPVTEFWPHLSILAALFYLAAIASKRFER